jgi:hypothetical protein
MASAPRRVCLSGCETRGRAFAEQTVKCNDTVESSDLFGEAVGPHEVARPPARPDDPQRNTARREFGMQPCDASFRDANSSICEEIPFDSLTDNSSIQVRSGGLFSSLFSFFMHFKFKLETLIQIASGRFRPWSPSFEVIRAGTEKSAEIDQRGGPHAWQCLGR